MITPLSYLPEMKSGAELMEEMSILPNYSGRICDESAASRLIALSDLYRIYLPSEMSCEIYSKLYLALLRSLQKKCTRLAVCQQNQNYRAIRQQEYHGIIGGSDSFTIIGVSGIGKSSAISRAVDLITGGKIIELNRPYTKIIPCLTVQCPFDASVKGLLLEILRKVDEEIHSNYYSNALKARTTTDMLIGSVSQAALNHIGLLIVDEIQNVVNSKNGKSLIGSLTQLINNSGISICMVGTPESTIFFEQAMQLARRSLGLQYGALPYGTYFVELCKTLFNYQYTRNRTALNEGILEWLYEHSGGVTSIVVSLIHDAQEISILNGTETLNLDTLNEAYKKRMQMLHSYLDSGIKPKKQTTHYHPKQIGIQQENTDITVKRLISQMAVKAKQEHLDIINLLRECITIEVVVV